ncbi:MAG TPA: cytochrome b [Acidisphaera sp.]|nr:cytochrome b [Acidisphaera sp.]
MVASGGKYTRLAMALHWIVAALIVANVALAWTWKYVPDDAVRPLIDTHKSIGITVLGLAILRVLWRAAHPPPPLPRSYSSFERAGAHAAHAALYVLIFALPITGWLHDSAWRAAPTHPMYWFGLFYWPRFGFLQGYPAAEQDHLHDVLGLVHIYFGYVLYALFTLHVAAALKHQFVDRDAELQRMLPWGRV